VYRILIKVLFIKVLIERAKEFLLKLKASKRIASEENASEESAPEHTSSEAKSSKARSSEARLSEASHHKPLHQKLNRVDKVQCTKCTTTNSAHASATTISATCLYIKTSIIVIFLQTLFRLKWNGFEISSS